MNIATKNPFPFSTFKLYRLSEHDLVLASWDKWGEIVDSHFGSAQCLHGYGVNFFYTRDDDDTTLIPILMVNDPVFNVDVPSYKHNYGDYYPRSLEIYEQMGSL